MKRLLWTPAIALIAMACLAACDESSSASGLSIAEFKTESALPNTCAMEVAKVDTTYFACQENKWIEVTDSATIEKIKDGVEEDELKEALEDMLENVPAPTQKPSSSSRKIESSDNEDPESSASEEVCTGRRCGSSSSKKSDSNSPGSGNSESGSSSPSSTTSSSPSSSSNSSPTSGKCGSETIDLSKQFCYKDIIYDLCGDVKYIPVAQECKDGTVITLSCVDDVYLTSYGDGKLAVIKVVKEYTGLGLAEAKELVDAAPSVLAEAMESNKASEFLKALTDAGATASLKNGTCSETGCPAYDEAEEFCFNGKLYNLCGGAKYIPDAQECKDGTVTTLSCVADVYMTSYGDGKLAVIQVVREYTGLGLAQAKELVESVPTTLIEAMSLDKAKDFLEALTSARATASLNNSSCPE